MTRLLEKVSRRTEQVRKKHDVILSDATRDDGELCALCACERIRQVFALGFFCIEAATGVAVRAWAGEGLSGDVTL